jgi:hypothetical protein
VVDEGVTFQPTPHLPARVPLVRGLLETGYLW